VTSIYLKASLPKLSKKLFKKKAKRPLIAHIATEEDMAEFIGKHLFERSHFYNKAQITVLTDDKNKEEVATAVLEQLF
jgi:shikimate kinase